MAWVQARKKKIGTSRLYGDNWRVQPAVAINKSGVTFNEAFLSTFMNGSKGVVVFYNKEERCIGFKTPGPQDGDAGDIYSLRHSSPTAKTSRMIGWSKPGKMWPDSTGRAYRATLNGGERMIVVKVCAENELSG